ncbi:hypothetical protein P170DRAFT_511328 [Aspergillus steynii IBT 23096]|uniref:Prion-inhibition and propagation HeLo domain-containing protein n=1 Tax=Aspergillus steynii IBT 23096 TaxID=1392250 RepID=A0A2I2G156_9EURO|nr:uncharacterized protein P170DRAFT_511328 [Aspergillus steynii IBT 23096]PLB46614.1 hypothetical protein P170DRAFT_511328 [Aspergillus steynii IBT 23096]
MADPLSVTFAVAGIPGIFTSFLSCFEYVQLGRKFGRDYEDSMLKLELERLRLSRWGEKVDINLADPNYVQIQLSLGSCTDTSRAREVLTLILDLFRDTEKVANRYRVKRIAQLAPTSTSARSESMTLYQKTRDLSIKHRQRGTTTLKKTIWVLYDQKYLSGLLKELDEMIGKLEELFPDKAEDDVAAGKSGKEQTIGEQSDDRVIGRNDPLLPEILEKKGKGHLYYNMKVGGDAKVYNGDLLTPGDKPRGRGHAYLDITVGGNVKVRFGNDQTGGTALWNM